MQRRKQGDRSSKGTLILHGGGRLGRDGAFKQRFLESAGGRGTGLVYIPTAFSDEQLSGEFSIHLDPAFVKKRFGFEHVHILHTRDRKEADSKGFAGTIRDADAVFITGGRQWRLADAYLDTMVHEELVDLLERGGVIAGTSAGATIQGGILVRGNAEPDDNRIVLGDHRRGFGLLADVAIDQHFLRHKRQFDMFEVFGSYPQALGIGIDEETFCIVRDGKMEICGRSVAAVYDGPRISKMSDSFTDIHEETEGFFLLRDGDRFDLIAREKTGRLPLPG